ncbi:MAG: hypothetical protein ABI462_06885 [Ignavibacteria bacterium]
MNIIEKKIQVNKTATYYTILPGSSEVKDVWIVIHGYAQLAKDFIHEFEFLSDSKTLIAAPEGLSKFYFRDKIGASWMTKEDRENEIGDYLNYLDKLFNELKSNFNFKIEDVEVNLLGFSQGVHTAVRWFTHTDERIKRLILYSSDFPTDADFNKLKDKLVNSEMFFIYGTKDEIIGQKRLQETQQLLREHEINFTKMTFDAGHKIEKTVLRKIIK